MIIELPHEETQFGSLLINGKLIVKIRDSQELWHKKINEGHLISTIHMQLILTHFGKNCKFSHGQVNFMLLLVSPSI